MTNPIDLAMRFLKNEWDYVDDNVLPENDPDYIYPNEQMWNDEADDDLKEKTNALWEYIESMRPQDKLMMLNQMDNPMLAMGINTDPRNRADMTDEETEKYINDAIWEMMFDAWQDSQLEMPGGIDFDLGGNRKSGESGDPVRAHAVAPSQWKKLASKPMDLSWRLLKRQTSLGDFDTSSGLMQTTPENPRHRKWAKRGGTTKLPIKITDPHNLYLTHDRGMYRLVHPEHGPVSSVMTAGSADPDFDVMPPQPGRRRLGSDKKPSTVYIEQGKTYPQFQRQGMYEKLLNSVINALPENASLMSHARNEMSGPFHMKYSKNLPRGVTMSEPMDKRGRDLWETRMDELVEDHEGIGEPVPDSHRTMRFAPLAYTRDLSQPEFGSLRPMVEGAAWMPPNVARGRLSPNVRPGWESKSQQTQFDTKTGQARGYESKYGRFLPMPWGDVAVKIPQNMPGVTRPLPMSSIIDMKLRQSAFDEGNLTGHDMTTNPIQRPADYRDAADVALQMQRNRAAAQAESDAIRAAYAEATTLPMAPTAQPAYNAVMGTSTDPNPSAAERFEF